MSKSRKKMNGEMKRKKRKTGYLYSSRKSEAPSSPLRVKLADAVYFVTGGRIVHYEVEVFFSPK